MGLQPTIGVEVEFHLFDKENPDTIHPVCETQLYKIRDDIIKELRHLGPDFPIQNSPVYRFHKEGKTNKYELSLNPAYADKAVDAVEAAVSHGRNAIHKLGNFKTSLNAIPRSRLVPALHTSLGFIINDTDAFNGIANNDNPSAARNLIAEHMKQALSDLIPLFAPKPDSYVRYLMNFRTTPKEVSVSHDNKKCKSGIRVVSHLAYQSPHDLSIKYISHRIENRLPGADTPIYKAILGTMLPALAATRKIITRDTNGMVIKDSMERIDCTYTGPLPADEQLPHSLEESAKRFSKSKYLWDMLDALAPEEKIGTQLFEHEQSRVSYILRTHKADKFTVMSI